MILPVKTSLLSILLTVVIAVHAIASGASGVSGAAVLCLGGGYRHAPAEAEHCESACSHDAVWPLSVPVNEHEHECSCTDVELTIAELLTLPRSDDGGKVRPAVVSTPAWGIVIAGSGLGRRGPPVPPDWFDPGGVHRLAIVASVRLTI